MQIVIQIPFVRNYASRTDEFRVSSLHNFARQFEQEEYYVRNPAFEEQHWEVLTGLYRKFDGALTELLNFTADEAIELCLSIGRLVNRKVANHFESMLDYADQQYYEILRYKSGGRLTNVYPTDILENLISLSKKDLKNHFLSTSSLYAATTLGHFYSFTSDELVQESEYSKPKVLSFLDALSISFQGVPIDFFEPRSVHPLKNTPIIEGDRRFIVPSFSLLDWSLDRLFERVMLGSTKYSDKFKEAKASFLVDKTLQLLKEIMPLSNVYDSLEYFDGAKNGETDGLVILDDCLFIIEGKSHKITDSAREGKQKRVQRHIEEILSHAYMQACKALAYIENHHEVTFRSRSKKVQIMRDNFNHKFLVIATLEPIGHIVSLIRRDNELGLFDGKHFPYAVSIYDLMVIRDVFDFATLFPFYLQRRQEFFSNSKVLVSDEIDVIGTFLNSKLHIDHFSPNHEYDFIQIEGFLDEFNQYYFHKQGLIRKPYPKPRFKISTKLLKFILALENSDLKNRISYLLLLISCNGDTQEEFIRRVLTAKKEFKRDRNLHDFSFTVPDKNFHWGITYMVGTPRMIEEELGKYCEFKLRQLKIDCWVGVGDISISDYQFNSVIVLYKDK